MVGPELGCIHPQPDRRETSGFMDIMGALAFALGNAVHAMVLVLQLGMILQALGWH